VAVDLLPFQAEDDVEIFQLFGGKPLAHGEYTDAVLKKDASEITVHQVVLFKNGRAVHQGVFGNADGQLLPGLQKRVVVADDLLEGPFDNRVPFGVRFEISAGDIELDNQAGQRFDIDTVVLEDGAGSGAHGPHWEAREI